MSQTCELLVDLISVLYLQDLDRPAGYTEVVRHVHTMMAIGYQEKKKKRRQGVSELIDRKQKKDQDIRRGQSGLRVSGISVQAWRLKLS